MTIPLVDEATVFTESQHSIHSLRTVLLRLIEAVATASLTGRRGVSNFGIKDGYWRMVVEQDKHLNISYVLPDVEGTCIRLVIPY